MCGIIGYIGEKENAAEILHASLKKLEYRGYDSCGIALSIDHSVKTFKAIGSPEKLFYKKYPASSCGLGHTRWATHGKVNIENAHPHFSQDKKVFLVHNGVIENSEQIKKRLEEEGTSFYGDTDSEILVNLISRRYKELSCPVKSLGQALSEVEGAYGIAVIFLEFPDNIYGGRRSSPLVLGIGENENFLASDANALPPKINKVIYLEDNQIVNISKKEYDIYCDDGTPSELLEIKKIKNRNIDFELGDYSSFMEKEIFEQPVAIRETFRGRFDKDFSEIKLGGIAPNKVKRVLFLGCGTAYHAGMLGKYYMENIAHIPASVESSSEYKYKNNPSEKDTLVVAISQSGETIDTLSAIREAKNKGYRVVAVTNTVSSSIAREVEEGIYQRIGAEISVASTKAFSSQCVILLMLALSIGRKNKLSRIDSQKYIKQIRELPELMERTLLLNDEVRELALMQQVYEEYGTSTQLGGSTAIDFLGRQYLYPVALEGALKLKELSYLDSHAYPAGEIKHGPLATVRRGRLCFFLATQESLFGKNESNLKEIKSRGGEVALISQEGLDFPKDCYDFLLRVPRAGEAISPMLTTIPLQLFSMHMAIIKKHNVDKPRNLAKSVTVE
ncbi:glutamine--fructose-6-phosphate transaminase (isomerizing) [bacterium]|nr:glutamine--fructose-6-phosphate transaminase (isomerizing) [bacterium]